ncbi:AMP-binding protein [Phenylobacterium sp. LH3H17]|uniref:AMP-binding protein n=1 Tax=Phenylobacterium sp. LH3H17 TaxID=2903901 RepID=UPI0020C95B68|nr:AMP-binding protein [Phenylobacterium sp. LH3H17]UTP38420.1 AMP-binding protein [Phenylobacterium sp. LH3H17]
MDAASAELDLGRRVTEAAQVGMMHAVWAQISPDKVAVYDPDGATRTFGALNANANRIVRRMRAAGLVEGDSVALLCTNRAEFVEVLSAAMRAGMRITPVNWHLTADEIAYVIADCQAKALFADARVATAKAAADQCPALKLKVAIGGAIEGFEAYEATLAPLGGSDIPDPVRGHTMLYTSGTTGRPKGVFKPDAPIPEFNAIYDRDVDLHMCAGPAYHAAPLLGDVRRPLMNGVPLVFIDKWDTEGVLKVMAERRVTRTHLVPIMFQRMLALPDEVRAKYDLSSLRAITHGAAPCPPEVKHAMIAWVGPVLNEYYAGSEGGAGFLVGSKEWLTKPGTVGRRPYPEAARILDEDGNDCPQGTAGTIYMKLPDGGFQYYNDPAKTASNRREGYFTLGDIGYFDEDDYLFLTGRSAETIIAGGVNIYPQEIDNELIKHPDVEDSCTVGVPHEERGEEVRAVIQLKAGRQASPEVARAILDYANANLAKYKVPRSIDFVPELPRSAAGKILRNKVRAPYWEGRARQI